MKTAVSDWERMFNVLGIFIQTHGHGDVPPNPAPDSLGHWLAGQRRLYRAGQLPPESARRLESAGVRLTVPVAKQGTRDWQNERFELNFAKLVAYKKRFGHCRVQAHWSEDPGFGHWVANQRIARRQGKLSPERIARLDSLNFKWSGYGDPDNPEETGGQWFGSKDEHWLQMLAAVDRYQKKHGHTQVAQADGMDGKLYAWVLRCRMQGNRNKLRADRRRRLEEIGFEWHGGRANQDRWDKRFARLVAFKKRFGHCRVQAHWSKDPGFGHWVANQRIFRRQGKLTPAQIERLDRIGFIWAVRARLHDPPGTHEYLEKPQNAEWDRQFAELVEYKKLQGDCRIAYTNPRWRSLFKWVLRQRVHEQKRLLTAAHRARLDRLGFQWQAFNPAWDQKFDMLLAYRKRLGHCVIPAKWPENQPLASWVHHQREFKRHGTLKPERVARLNAIGFEWGRKRPVKRPGKPATSRISSKPCAP